MNNKNMEVIHATAISIENCGILLCGKSGSGKSDLALRLIDRGAVLIGDDIVHLQRDNENLLVTTAEEIGGKIEVRSIGIVEFPHQSSAHLKLKVRLEEDVDRYPLDRQVETILDESVPTIAIDPKEASAPIKVELALKQVLETANQS